MKILISALTIAATALLSGCTSSQSRMQALGSFVPEPRPTNCAVEVWKTAQPTQPFLKVARLDVHQEAMHFMQPSFEDLLPDLKKQACLAGADAIMDIVETQGGYLEMRSEHVTATAIIYQ